MAAPMWRRFGVQLSYKSSNYSLAPTWCRISYFIQKCQMSSAAPDQSNSIANSDGDSFDEIIDEKTIEKTPKAHYENLRRIPDQPLDARVLKLAVIGIPNAGKSTLVNRLMGWKVSPVSSKVHTTRKNTNAVLTENNTQIIFVDTPGLMTASKMKKHNTEKEMVYGPELGVQSADLIAVIVDAADKWTRDALDQKVLKVLQLHKHTPSVLVLNKVDAMKKKVMLIPITRQLTRGVVGGTNIQITGSQLKRERQQEFDAKNFFQKIQDRVVTSDGNLDIAAYLEDKKKVVKEEEESFPWESSGYKTPVISLQQRKKETFKNQTVIAENQKDTCENLQSSIDSKPTSHMSQLNQDTDKTKVITIQKNEVNELVLHVLDDTTAKPEKNKDKKQRLYTEYIKRIESVAKEVRDIEGWPYFSRVFMISALENDGVEEFKDYLVKQAKAGDWMYHSSVLVDENPFEIAKQIVWEKLLEYLPKNMPYQLHPEIVLWEVDRDGTLSIIMDIETPKVAELRLLLGKDGVNIRNISQEAKQGLLNTFRCELNLRLQIKLAKAARKIKDN
ncbi:GTPase Era, mitochondrial-like [Mytilus californianus]|uniref:GTPase Era, mitochondrial-like n=1 Tax=Mytilus californianus TaxID=6549 RepID=UPI0022472AAD|nr:GTPase Era, mitochondrial-like [Mytilus californianus]